MRGHRENIAVVGPHSLLWPKATTFERSQRGVFLVASPTVHCGQRPQQLGDQSTVGCWRFFSTVRYIAIFYYKHVDMIITIDI